METTRTQTCCCTPTQRSSTNPNSDRQEQSSYHRKEEHVSEEKRQAKRTTLLKVSCFTLTPQSLKCWKSSHTGKGTDKILRLHRWLRKWRQGSAIQAALGKCSKSSILQLLVFLQLETRVHWSISSPIYSYKLWLDCFEKCLRVTKKPYFYHWLFLLYMISVWMVIFTAAHWYAIMPYI